MNTVKSPILKSLCIAGVLAFGGCNFWDDACTCTDELRINVCVEGKYDGRDSISYVRERRGLGVVEGDSAWQDCFAEASQDQRILVLENGARIDSSDWFRQKTVDCCHQEAATISF